VKVEIEGQARKFAFEVEFVFGAVGGMVENGVGVVEDIFFGDGGGSVLDMLFGSVEVPVGQVSRRFSNIFETLPACRLCSLT